MKVVVFYAFIKSENHMLYLYCILDSYIYYVLELYLCNIFKYILEYLIYKKYISGYLLELYNYNISSYKISIIYKGHSIAYGPFIFSKLKISA